MLNLIIITFLYIDKTDENINFLINCILGTIGSAKLLMLSGIGPKEHLNEMNVCINAVN